MKEEWIKAEKNSRTICMYIDGLGNVDDVISILPGC